MFRKALTYDDVLLVPKYSNINSRKTISLNSMLDDSLELDIPIISSPMDTVTELEMCVKMAELGGLGILHRYNSKEEQAGLVANFKELHPTYKIAAAVGINGDFLDRAELLIENGVDILCLDVAHGHHSLMKNAIQLIRNISDTIHIMAGNVATLDGVNDLADWGANSVRIGVGGGSICSTRIMTGHGLPSFQTILDCAKTDRDVKLIADGGIRESGDIVKALAAGADFVMLGSMLAGTDETPGEVETIPGGTKRKVYRGMASKEAQYDWKGKHSSNEGISSFVVYKGPLRYVVEDILNGVKSGLSYSGCNNIKELQTTCEFVQQSTAGLNESKTHIHYIAPK